MRRKFFIALIGVVSVLGAMLLPATAQGAGDGVSATPAPTKVPVHKIGHTRLETAPTGAAGVQSGGEVTRESGHVRPVTQPHRHPLSASQRSAAAASAIPPSQTLSVTHSERGWQGLNHFDQRTADNSNQFSTEPPDQGLCVGNGQAFETINTAVRSYSTGGKPLSAVMSLNQFFFHDHEINRTTGKLSPHSLGDPSCVYDAASKRFFVTTYDSVEDSAGKLLGPSFIDIAVSRAGTTLGRWKIYQLDVTDDGSNGTPNHQGCPCFGDYPHIGTDANGLYITENEYPTFSEKFHAAQVFAIDKQALVKGSADLPAVHFDTARQDFYKGVYYSGSTLAPALSSGSSYAPNAMYFLSSDAFSGDQPITSQQVLVWKIAHTSAIHANPLSLRLTHTTVPVRSYTVPPPATQKSGPLPQAACLNIDSCATDLLDGPDPYHEVKGKLDSNDSRMLQSAYAHGRLWGALDTAVDVGGQTRAGVAYYVIDPNGGLVKQGTLAVAGNDITYPALGVTSAGRGAMAMTLTGPGYFPSAAFVKINDVVGGPASSVTVVGAGKGPQDGFTEYKGYGTPLAPRWGDYGAAAVVGSSVWVASEYIAQSCTLQQYRADNTCGNTRTAIANWSTHIASVTP